jgi:hypothetical protein
MEKAMNRILVLVITMLSLLLEAGMGQERMLTCEFTDGTEPLSHDIYRNRGDKRIVLNEKEKTATLGNEPISKATFTDTTVMWDSRIEFGSGWCQGHYDLSRETGKLVIDQDCSSHTHNHSVYQCSVAQKKF